MVVTVMVMAMVMKMMITMMLYCKVVENEMQAER